MKKLLLLIFLSSNCMAIEPHYITEGRILLSNWGDIYCIKKHSLGDIASGDVNKSFHLFDYSEVVQSRIYSNKARDAIFKYIDDNISNYGQLSTGDSLKFIACQELRETTQYTDFVKKQDRYFFQYSLGVGAVIRIEGQISPFSGLWSMSSEYDKYSSRHFNKNDVFPGWEVTLDGGKVSGNEWVLEKRDDEGPVKLDVPYF